MTDTRPMRVRATTHERVRRYALDRGIRDIAALDELVEYATTDSKAAAFDDGFNRAIDEAIREVNELIAAFRKVPRGLETSVERREIEALRAAVRLIEELPNTNTNTETNP